MNGPADTPSVPVSGHTCPPGECYCPDGSEPRSCGHGPGGQCRNGCCIDCGGCNCDEDW